MKGRPSRLGGGIACLAKRATSLHLSDEDVICAFEMVACDCGVDLVRCLITCFFKIMRGCEAEARIRISKRRVCIQEVGECMQVQLAREGSGCSPGELVGYGTCSYVKLR